MSSQEASIQCGQKEIYPYDMTVVIPVYNKAESLDDCVKSLDGQRFSRGSYEVVLVNDGSTDGSLEICQRLASTRDNYVVVDQENQGVSAARNAGMKVARGRYIMFLDADDWISRGSIRHLVSTFDRYHDEVDLLTYPILYHSSEKSKATGHRRQYWMKESGVYDLSDYPFIAQTTVNICVKNDSEKRILFPVDLSMGEDQYFITSNLLEKGRIANCSNAAYHYIRSSVTSSSLGNYPLFVFDGMMKLFEFLSSSAKDHPEMADYLYSLIIYNIGWRVRSGMLYPDFGDEQTMEQNYARLECLLESIPLHCWLDNPYISDNLRLYFVKRHLHLTMPSISYTPEGTTIAFGDSEERTFRIPSLTIDWLVNKRDGLQVRGRLSGPSFIFEEKPRLFVEVDGADVELALKESSYSFDGAKTRITKAWYFETILPNTCEQGGLYRFSARMGERDIPALKLQFSTRRCNGRSVKTTSIREFESFSVGFDGNSLRTTPMRQLPPVIDQAVRLWRDAGRIGHRSTIIPLRRKLPKALKQISHERVWIYIDNPNVPSQGNAFVQFLHDIDIHDGVKRLYLTSCMDEILKENPRLSGNLLGFKTWDHMVYLLQAELIMSSFIDRLIIMPHEKGVTDRYADFAREQAFVYLQHGVLHAHMPWYCSYDRTMFDFEVISTSFEEDNLTSNYLFPSDALIRSGAPRLDALEYQSMPKQKKIALIPSWRGYLIGGNSAERIPKREALLKSSFYQGLMDFLNALNESGVLERYGYVLDLKLHPNFMAYEDLFTLEGSQIRLASGSINEGDYAVAITDYSSYLYDFVYAGARIMYFLPDEQEFRSGVNHYSSLDLPFDEGFGPYSTSPEDAVEKLELLLRQIEQGEGNDEYRNHADSFFLHHDRKNADRLYDELVRISTEFVKRDYS